MTERALSTHVEQEISEDKIEAVQRPECLVCGAEGETLYEGLRDRAFAAPGCWNFRKCQNSSCGVLWLDPMPTTTDLWKAYREYYTHGSNGEPTRRDYGTRVARARS